MINVLALSAPELLFDRALYDLIHSALHSAVAAVQQIDADVLLSTSTDDTATDLMTRHSFEAPFLRRDGAHIDGPHEVELSQHDYGRELRLRGTLLALVVPFDGDGGMFRVNPNLYGGAPRGNIREQHLILTTHGVDLKAEQVNEHFEARLKEIEHYLQLQKSMVEGQRVDLLARLRPEIEARKKKLLDARSMVSGLAFPIKARADSPKTYAAPVVRKKIVTLASPITAPFKPEPVLEEANYQAILSIIQSMALVMERSPSSFQTMSEETLRQQFLVPLNSHFEGAASGETFNFNGKTDILIRVQDRNIFIAECKFWSGEKNFLDTITQLLNYLSWRDTKAAVIIFNRNQNFSGVIDTIGNALPDHPNFKRELVKEAETRFRCVFGYPSDPHREIILTVLAFDVPRP